MNATSDVPSRLRDKLWFQAIAGILIALLAAIFGSVFLKQPTETISWEQQFLTKLNLRHFDEFAEDYYLYTDLAAKIGIPRQITVVTRQLRESGDALSEMSNYELRAALYLYIGRCDLSVRDLNLAISQGPAAGYLPYRAMSMRGNIWLGLHKYPQAMNDFDAASKILSQMHDISDMLDVHYSKGWVEVFLDKPKSALSEFDRALSQLGRQVPEPSPKCSGTIDKACQTNRRYRQLYLHFVAKIHQGRAQAYRELSDYHRSLAEYGLALTNQPIDGAAFNGRARTFLAEGDWTDGLRDVWKQMIANLSTIRTRRTIPPCSIEP